MANGIGNVRYSFDINGGNVRRLQEDDYYAFGLRKSVSPVVLDNKYLYNGKELQEELDGQYDYGARFYDPVIGRWNAVDPLAESYQPFSPYNYVLNNPLANIDPDGRSVRPGYVERNTLGLSDKRQPDELSSDPGDGKKKPEPKPIQLEEVVVYGKRSSSIDGNARKDALDWAATGVDFASAGVIMVADGKMSSLMRQGYTSGTSGLMGATAQSVKSLAGFGAALGYGATLVSGSVLVYEGVQVYNGNKQMDRGRFGYHVGSFLTAAGTGLSFGGPAGATVGLAAKSGEMAYDTSKQAVFTLNGQYNSFISSMVNAIMRTR